MEQEIFKVGDRVYDYTYGWGYIESLDDDNDYPIKATFNSGLGETYTKDGRSYASGNIVLSFTEYTLEGFSQERPSKFKDGDECVYVDRNRVFCKHVWDKNIQETYRDKLLTMEEFKQFINEKY